ncbi:MAG TPA: sugar phosphate nucleotidyltransferase [Candidatus Dormibacteraeota bacterium]
MIPAGGAGSRLWPRSRRSTPKHLLPLSGSGRPLLRETYERIRPLAAAVYVLTEQRQVPLIREILPELGPEHLIVEPAARGTTNALGLAALTLAQEDPEAVMVSTPADHVVRGRAEFAATIRRVSAVARASGDLVTVGLQPRYPATGLGYIEAREPVSAGRARALRVLRFVEKPDLARARRFLAAGDFYWNLAMFGWRLSSFLAELQQHGRAHFDGLQKVLAARRRGDEAAAARAYANLPVEVVDRTVMERTSRLLLVPATFDWIDVGSWTELADLLRQDAHGNVVEGEQVLIDTEACFISAPGKLVAAIGLRDVVIVDTPDALLVCPKSRAQDVRRVVEALGRDKKMAQYL